MEHLVFGYTLLATGWIRDFHPLEPALTGRNEKGAAAISRFATAPLLYFFTKGYLKHLGAVFFNLY